MYEVRGCIEPVIRELNNFIMHDSQQNRQTYRGRYQTEQNLRHWDTYIQNTRELSATRFKDRLSPNSCAENDTSKDLF